MRSKGIMSNVKQEICDLWKELSGFGKKPDGKLNCVRISRNIADFPFSCQANEVQKQKIIQEVMHACQYLPNFDNGWFTLNWRDCNTEERRLLSRLCLLENPTDATVLVFSKTKNIHIIINDCDHIRLQSIAADVRLKSSWRQLDSLDTQIEEHLEYCFDPEKGYSTCSTDTLGTGIKAFSLVHIPAICYKQQLSQTISALEAMSLKLEPCEKIEDRILGHLFFVTNTTSLGCSEEVLLDHIEKTVQTIVTQEDQVRRQLSAENENFIKDSVSRSLGVLRSCYELSFEESMNLISIVVMAMDLGFLDNKKRFALLNLWACKSIESLQQFLRKPLNVENEKQVRAEVVRKFFVKNENCCSIEAKEVAYVS